LLAHSRNVIDTEYQTEVNGSISTSEEVEESPTSSISSQDQLETGLVAPSMGTITEEPSGTEDTISNDSSDHNLAENVPSGNITLQRVTGVSMRHTKPPSAKVIMEGWMVHYTNKSLIRKKHYWRLDSKSVTFYKEQDSPHYYKEIQLADILAVDPMVNHVLYPLSPPHVFEIVTSTLTYYVGVDMAGAGPEDLTPPKDQEAFGGNILGDVSHLTLSQLEDIGVGLNIALGWEEAFHGALMPVTPQASMGSLADSKTIHRVL
jgi:protein kinase D